MTPQFVSLKVAQTLVQRDESRDSEITAGEVRTGHAEGRVAKPPRRSGSKVCDHDRSLITRKQKGEALSHPIAPAPFAVVSDQRRKKRSLITFDVHLPMASSGIVRTIAVIGNG